jgi:hypothetical protein
MVGGFCNSGASEEEDTCHMRRRIHVIERLGAFVIVVHLPSAMNKMGSRGREGAGKGVSLISAAT